ncbi:MAG: type II secretion system F family protein [Actinobacteria bacterium]|nr:type II secretion system F family protein [Actinomycetota bacterium]
MIISAMAAGAAVGAGLLLVARELLAPPPPALGRRLVELYQPPPRDTVAVAQARWQTWALRALASTGADMTSLRRDLAACAMTLERHAMAKLGFAVAGSGLPVVVAVVWRLVGIGVPVGAVALVALACAAGGFVLPDVLLARRAARRRRDFRYALSLFLDLVVIVLAGGGGVETALHDAGNAGSGWAFGELRRALATARLQRGSPWAALSALGDSLGSAELVELAASVELAGTSGARVRESLRAKATSARDHELSESEAEALAASERMGAPMVAMFVGLILLIGYPAMATVLAL